MMYGVTYIMSMCVLYCILHIRTPVRRVLFDYVFGHGEVFDASGRSGSPKTGFKRFMLLAPVTYMRSLLRRSLQGGQKLEKIRGKLRDL